MASEFRKGLAKEIKKALGLKRVVCRSLGKNYTGFSVMLRGFDPIHACTVYYFEDDEPGIIEIVRSEYDYFCKEAAKDALRLRGKLVEAQCEKAARL
jgi:hypothetical protein